MISSLLKKNLMKSLGRKRGWREKESPMRQKKKKLLQNKNNSLKKSDLLKKLKELLVKKKETTGSRTVKDGLTTCKRFMMPVLRS
jgi:transcription elongation factor GreA-like protein